MQIQKIQSLTEAQLADLLHLMQELDPTIPVSTEMLRRAVEAPQTHVFAAMEGGRIIGTASLCVFESPTGRKASVEDVVVDSRYRGQGLGRKLLEHVIGFARQELADVDLHLTSRPQRVAANALYRSLGFELLDTNAYVMKIRTL